MSALFGLMCGTGGLSISEWCRMKSYRMARLWVEGFNRRSDTMYRVGYCVARAAIAGRCKAPKDWPYDLNVVTGGAMKADEEMPELSETETNERLAQMEAALRARMRAANDGCNETR
jgi:hypothetical protein